MFFSMRIASISWLWIKQNKNGGGEWREEERDVERGWKKGWNRGERLIVDVDKNTEEAIIAIRENWKIKT